MTGDKPDERLRTPMHWARGRAAGFTTGNVWEPLQRDSMTANVAAQDRDAGSLLNLYRRLIHLRSANSALGSGELVPLTSSSNAVAAYLRRDGSRVVLVVANLGGTSASGVTISSAAAALPAGQYTLVSLLGSATAAPLDVAAGGAIASFTPLATLDARRTYVLELRKRAR
jgi:alpha-amylase